MKNVVAIGVDQCGRRQVLRVCERMKEDEETWRSLLRHVKDRDPKGIRLVTSDKSIAKLEVLPDSYPDASWQRCMVHLYTTSILMFLAARKRK